MGARLFRATRRFDLTQRQRDVLSLIAQGRTNAEIADDLGISLDGAKYHVREILGKLGVDSREEAAELWRAEQRPGARAKHWVGGLAGANGIRLGAVAAGSVVIAVGSLVFLVALMGDGEEGTGEPAGDVRYVEVVEEFHGPGGDLQSTARIVAWSSADGTRLRWESDEGSIRTIRVLDGDTIKTLKVQTDITTYSESRMLRENVLDSYRPLFLATDGFVKEGDPREVAREAKGGKTIVTVRHTVTGQAEGGETEGQPRVTAVEVVYEEESGFLLEMRTYTRTPDGTEELVGARRFRYVVDTYVREDGIFEVQVPPGAWVYLDREWPFDELTAFRPFALFYLGPEFHRMPLVLAKEIGDTNTPTGGHHMFQFVYGSSALTVTNQPAESLARLQRCDSPGTVIPSSTGDVVLDWNRACGYGVEIETRLGPAVLRNDVPTVEIQIGETVVFVIASSHDLAIEAADALMAAN